MITLADYDDHTYVCITSPDEIVGADWSYDYDLWHSYERDPDMAVRPEWVGKRASDVCPAAWDYFRRPVVNWQI